MPAFITEFLQLLEAYPIPNKFLLGLVIVFSGVAACYFSLRYLFSEEKVAIESHKIPLEPESKVTYDTKTTQNLADSPGDNKPNTDEGTTIKDSWRPDSVDQWKEKRAFLKKNQNSLLKVYVPIVLVSKDKVQYIYKSDFPFSVHWLNLWRAGFYTPELQIILLSMLIKKKPMGYKEDLSFVLNYQPKEEKFKQLKRLFYPDHEQVKSALLSMETSDLPHQVLFSKVLEVRGLVFSREWYKSWGRRLGLKTIHNPLIVQQIYEKSSLPLKLQLSKNGYLSENLSWRDFLRRQIFYYGNYKRASLLNLESEPGYGLLAQESGKLDNEMIKHADVLFKKQVFEKIHQFNLRAAHIQSIFKKNEVRFNSEEIAFFQSQFEKMPARIKQSWMMILRDHNEHVFLLDNINRFPRGLRRTVILRYEAERLYREKKYPEALSALKRALSYDTGNLQLLKAGFLYSFYAKNDKARKAFFNKLQSFQPDIMEMDTLQQLKKLF